MSAPPIVFIHGIKGCSLRRGRKQVYLTVSQLLSLDTPDLSLPIEWDDKTNRQGTDGVTPGEPLENVLCCLSGFAGAQGYAKFLQWARKEYGSEHVRYDFHLF